MTFAKQVLSIIVTLYRLSLLGLGYSDPSMPHALTLLPTGGGGHFYPTPPEYQLQL